MYVKHEEQGIQGNRLRKSPIIHNSQGIRERPGTALTFTGKRALDGSIGFEHLHTEFTKHIDDNGWRIKEILNAMSRNLLHLSDGAVYQFIRQFSEKIEPTLEAIKTDLLNQNLKPANAVPSISFVLSTLFGFARETC